MDNNFGSGRGLSAGGCGGGFMPSVESRLSNIEARLRKIESKNNEVFDREKEVDLARAAWSIKNDAGHFEQPPFAEFLVGWLACVKSRTSK